MLKCGYPLSYKSFPLLFFLDFRATKYFNPAKGFFMTLLEPSVRVTADVYAYMFFCDFFNFLVVIFGFASFGVSINSKNVP